MLRPAHHKRVLVPKLGRTLLSLSLTFLSSYRTYLTRRVDFRSVPFRFILQVNFEAFVWKFRFFECKLRLRMSKKKGRCEY